MKRFVSVGVCFLFLIPSAWLSADSPFPHNIEFTEGHEKYDAMGALDPHDASQFIGFQILDNKGQLIQLVDSPMLDLAYYGPEYTFNALHFDDFNFDGFPDIALPGDGSTSHAPYFDIWLWDPKQRKFVEDEALNDAQISKVDSKTRRLYSEYSYHGFSSVSEYTYSSGKIVLISSDDVDSKKNEEVKKFYANGKVIKTVTSEPKPPE